MPPPTTIERRSSDRQQGTITIALLVSLGAAIIVSLLVVILVLLRKRKNESQEIPYGVPPPTGTHKSKVSSTNMKSLLENDLGRSKKPLHVTLQFTDENARQGYDTSLTKPNEPSRTSPHTLPLLSSTLSSSRLHQDVNPINDYHNKRPPFPPLVIPTDPQSTQTQILSADEDSSSAQPLSTSSSPSLYSQQTAESAPTKPGLVEISLSPECPHSERRTTLLVGTLLKARAQRNPKGLAHENSQISHIERSESIKSVISTRHDSRPFSERYRSRKEKNTS